MLFERDLRLIHATDLGPARTFVQQAGEFGELCGSAGGVYFHTAVVRRCAPNRSVPIAFAACSTKYRKPTPWTRPRTRYSRAVFCELKAA